MAFCLGVCVHILVLPCILRRAMLIPLRRLSKTRHAARVQWLPCSAGCDALHVTLCMLEQYNHIASYFHCQKKWSRRSDTCVCVCVRHRAEHCHLRGPKQKCGSTPGRQMCNCLGHRNLLGNFGICAIGCAHKTRSF